MNKRQIFALIFGFALIGAQFAWQSQGTLSHAGDAVQLRCDQGQSAAVVEVPATTGPTTAPTTAPTAGPTTFPTTYPTTFPFAGQVTIATAAARYTAGGSVPGPYGSPFAVQPAGSPTYAPVVSTFPAKFYVTLGADQFVEATYSSPNPGGAPNTVTLTCVK